MQPINYGVEIQDPTQSFLSAFQTGAAIQDIGLKKQQQQQQMANQKVILDGLAKIRQPGATVDDVANLAMILPKDQSETVLKAFALKTDAQKQNALGSAGKVVSALFAGENDIAMQYLNDQATSMRNSGNEEGARFLDTWRDVTRVNPTASQNFFTAELLRLPGGEKIVENIIALRGERRLEAEAKPKLAELEAKAISAGVAADFARPVAEAELAKTKAETIAPSVRESIDFANLKPDQQQTFKALQILKKPPAAVTNVNVSNVDKTASAELGKLIPDLYNQGNAALTQLADIARYRVSLDTAITGPFADQRLAGARIANALGFVGDKAINSSRELIQGNAEMALGARGMMKGQGEITKDEQKLLIQARAGDINFTKGELKTLFNVFERASTAQYTQSRKLLESAAKESPTAKMFLENMRPLAQPEAPKPAAPTAPTAPTAPAAPGMPAGFRVIQRG